MLLKDLFHVGFIKSSTLGEGLSGLGLFVLWSSPYKVTCCNRYVQRQMFIADFTESNIEIMQH